jgi:hypothetical protein
VNDTPARTPQGRRLEELEAQNRELLAQLGELKRDLERSSHSGNSWNPIALFGAVTTLLGVIGAAIFGYLGSGEGNAASRQAMVCQQAYVFLADERPTPYLTEAEGRALAARQLQVLRKCEKFVP